jgi:hypothetical protein
MMSVAPVFPIKCVTDEEALVVAKYLNVANTIILRLEEWSRVFFAIVKGHRPTFVSKKMIRSLLKSNLEPGCAVKSNPSERSVDSSADSSAREKQKEVERTIELLRKSIAERKEQLERNLDSGRRKKTLNAAQVKRLGKDIRYDEGSLKDLTFFSSLQVGDWLEKEGKVGKVLELNLRGGKRPSILIDWSMKHSPIYENITPSLRKIDREGASKFDRGDRVQDGEENILLVHDFYSLEGVAQPILQRLDGSYLEGRIEGIELIKEDLPWQVKDSRLYIVYILNKNPEWVTDWALIGDYRTKPEYIQRALSSLKSFGAVVDSQKDGQTWWTSAEIPAPSEYRKWSIYELNHFAQKNSTKGEKHLVSI